MNDEPPRDASNLSRRKAWFFTSSDRPGFSAFRAGGSERERFLRYWVKENLWNMAHLLGHYSLKLLPMDKVSALGAALGRFAMPRFHKVAEHRARETVRKLRPDLSEAEREDLVIENQKSQGRIMTEFSVVNRIAEHPDRLQYHGLEIIDEAVRAGPTIIVGLHLGNWEVGPIILKKINVSPHIFYVPPAERAKAWIAERVRTKAGVQFLPPGFQGVRPAVKILRQGGVVSAFCDEGFQGVIRGPFFGRPPHMEGNIALIIRLARMTGATICPWYNIRTDGFRFEARALDPIRLPPEEKSGERFVEDMLLLNAAIEPVVLAHLDQWYFLDSAL
ncbi:MAG: lipid A biosynthesis lauroyl acyltransferase [Shinella sp.]|uniref:lysophospholipid acyltransferase family protein n=1 Tax=Shinella sp. TaxID=1870904 RepID=UPI003C71DC16